jgi:hypothetical protein
MSVFVGLFWSLFINDMVGDKNPTRGVIAAVMMIITFPLVFIPLQRVLSYINTHTSSNSSSSSYKYRINDAIERTSQAVHARIWIWIYSMLMIKDMIDTNTDTNTNTNTNDNDNDNSNGRESSMTETLSPMRSIRIQ